jgi:hypothetical protein
MISAVGQRPSAAASGVGEMRNCPVTHEEIRRRMLEKIDHHKTRLFELLDTICSAEGLRLDLRCRWESWAVSPSNCFSVTPVTIRKHIENAAISLMYSPK